MAVTERSDQNPLQRASQLVDLFDKTVEQVKSSRPLHCRIEPFIGSRRRLAALLARRQRRALPWRPARRTPGHPQGSKINSAHATPVVPALASGPQRRVSCGAAAMRLLSSPPRSITTAAIAAPVNGEKDAR
jgi:hypothetical protein